MTCGTLVLWPRMEPTPPAMEVWSLSHWTAKEAQMVIIFNSSNVIWLPRWHSGKESACQCKRRKRCTFSPWIGKIPWRRKWQLAPVFLPEKFHGQRSLAGYGPWGRKELDITEWLSTHIMLLLVALMFNRENTRPDMKQRGRRHENLNGDLLSLDFILEMEGSQECLDQR